MVDAANTSTGPSEASSGPVQAPDAAQVQALSPESRAAIARELSFRYPGQKQQIDEWYQQTPAPPSTLATQLGEGGFAPGDATGNDIDLTASTRELILDQGHDAAEVGAFAADLKANLATLGLPPAIAASVGESMIRAAVQSQGDPDPETTNARWASQIRPQIESIARNWDGSKASWDQVQQGVQAAFAKLPPEFRDEVIKSGALNSASVVLQLFTAGQRSLAREAMSKGA